MLQNGGWSPQGRHSMNRINSSVGNGLNDDGNHYRKDFQLLWVKCVDKSLAHESTQHAIVHRRRVLRDVTCMMNMLDAVITVDVSRL